MCIRDRVKAEAGRLPEPVRTLVATLSATSNAAATGAARANLASSVNSSIGEFCKQAINGRYPFARNSTTDVTQEDFGRLFKPGGLFDEFFQKNLAALVDTNTRPWTFRQLGEGAITRDSATLAQFQRAAAIRDTFFRSGGATPSLRLEFKPQEMDETITQFTLDFDGQLVKYSHGPSVVMPDEPLASAGCSCTRTCVLPFGPGHWIAVGICGPCEYLTSWPSKSSVNCVIVSSISCGLNSRRSDGVAPPERKKVSRIAAARWNCASVAESRVIAPSPSWRKVHGRVLVSTSAARFFWKNSSNRPPGLKRRPKSSCVTSVVLLRANG